MFILVTVMLWLRLGFWKDAVEPAFAFYIHTPFEHDSSDLYPPTTAVPTCVERYRLCPPGPVDEPTTHRWIAFALQPLPSSTMLSLTRTSSEVCHFDRVHAGVDGCTLNIPFALDSCCEASVLKGHNATACTDATFESEPDKMRLKITSVWEPD